MIVWVKDIQLGVGGGKHMAYSGYNTDKGRREVGPRTHRVLIPLEERDCSNDTGVIQCRAK